MYLAAVAVLVVVATLCYVSTLPNPYYTLYQLVKLDRRLKEKCDILRAEQRERAERERALREVEEEKRRKENEEGARQRVLLRQQEEQRLVDVIRAEQERELVWLGARDARRDEERRSKEEKVKAKKTQKEQKWIARREELERDAEMKRTRREKEEQGNDPSRLVGFALMMHNLKVRRARTEANLAFEKRFVPAKEDKIALPRRSE